MSQKTRIPFLCGFFIAMLAAALLTGCASAPNKCCGMQAAAAVAYAPMRPVVRIDAGSATNYTDAAGNVWLSDRGFCGGDVGTRGDDMAIANTTDPGLFRTEHYGMNSFYQPLPNGKYVVKLYFAETYDGIKGPGERLFSFNVKGRQFGDGQEFDDFDVWAKAGGPRRAFVQTVNVDITDEKLDITFESGTENPEINAIEIIPAP